MMLDKQPVGLDHISASTNNRVKHEHPMKMIGTFRRPQLGEFVHTVLRVDRSTHQQPHELSRQPSGSGINHLRCCAMDRAGLSATFGFQPNRHARSAPPSTRDSAWVPWYMVGTYLATSTR